MPYASPSASPTVVLTSSGLSPYAHAPPSSSIARDIVLGQSSSFVFPAPPPPASQSRSNTPSPVPASAMASSDSSTGNKSAGKSSSVLRESENKENSGPSRAVGPMPLIPRTSSNSRLRAMSPGTLTTTRPAPSPPPAAAPPPAAVTPVPAVLNPSPPHQRASPPLAAGAGRGSQHARKPSFASVGLPPNRELTASPQQPSPPPSSPVSSRGGAANLRLDLLTLKRTLSEAQVVTQHQRYAHHHVHAHSHSGLLHPIPPQTASAIVTSTPMMETPPQLPLSRSEIMIRKKSGELVKSAIRTPGSSARKFTKSEPTTPTGPKFVHFDAQLEHVKLFLAEQKPAAVSRDGSPTETTSEGELSSGTSASEYPFPLAYASSDDEKIRRALSIRVLNMPPPSRVDHEADVRLEELRLSDDARALNGTVVVRNIAFAKWVAVRFTLDRWQTTSEVSARYLDTLPLGGFDRFAFGIRLVDVLPRIEAKTMELAVRYTCGGREMWDNNRGENYRVEFVKRPVLVGFTSVGAAAAAGENKGHTRQTKSVPAVTLTASSSTESSVGSGGAEGEREKGAGRTEWPVRSAVGDQMADLRRELERVVREEMSPPQQSVGGKVGKGEKGGLRNMGQQDNFADASASPLGKRYSFGASLKSPSWRPSPSLDAAPSPPPSSASFPTSTTTSSSPRKHASPLHSRAASGSSSPSSSVPFPSIASKPRITTSPPRSPQPPHYLQLQSFTPPPGSGDLPRMAPRGSPRDAPYEAVTAPSLLMPQEQPQRYDGLPNNSGMGTKRRHHQRSYFDNWPSFGAASIRKTPPGTPGGGAGGLGSPGRFNSYPPLSPAREDVPRPSPPHQHQQHQEVGTSMAPTVPAVPWANLLPLPPSPPEDSTTSSTPSISGTEASSVQSQSPMSPPAPGSAGLPPMPLASMMALEQEGGADSLTYFLDRFCFYTGSPTDPPPSSLNLSSSSSPGSGGEATPRRALSASSLPLPTFSSPPGEFVATFAASPGTSPSKARLIVPLPPMPPAAGTDLPTPVSPPSEVA